MAAYNLWPDIENITWTGIERTKDMIKVKSYKPQEERYKKMEAVVSACREARVKVHQDVNEYFYHASRESEDIPSRRYIPIAGPGGVVIRIEDIPEWVEEILVTW